jgi:hypothetical protein
VVNRRFTNPQKRKPKLAKICQDCKRAPAIRVVYMKWYRGSPIGSHNIRWVSVCSDCYITALCAGDIFPEPKII